MGTSMITGAILEILLGKETLHENFLIIMMFVILPLSCLTAHWSYKRRVQEEKDAEQRILITTESKDKP